ncbi:hypothetical protein JOD54_002018 [Actinokineospora baliensis]|uniref:tachylectin-related carbohydrate-binding protein n=1 Tax=Actinokineospora baliensis TaxID=547056 RepID=UPI00195ED50F|nr:tachylectin-related carbohydrate-binding protein [Actinokineospora baliensis]MBM7771814.1 hypothetical protein [Actinokineospora baliensis]
MHDIRRAGVLVAAVLAATCLSATSASAAPAAGPPVCSPAVDVFGVEPDGRLFVYPHNEPETGAASWGAKRYIGSGWNGGTVMAGPGGWIHYVTKGDLQHRRYQWTGSSWATFGGRQYQDLGRLDPATSEKITVDERGRLLTNGTTGFTASSWDDQGRFLSKGLQLGFPGATGDMIASGDGGFFLRSGDLLLRYRFEFDSLHWAVTGQVVGRGFSSFKRLFGGGGGVLYGVANDAAGTLLWYRYDDAAGTWANNGIGKVVGSGWNTLAGTSAAGCTTPVAVPPQPEPPVPPVPPVPEPPLPAAHDERPALRFNENTRTYEAAWVNNNGQLLFGAEDPQDPTKVNWTAMSGYQGYTGTASVAREYGAKGRAFVSASSQDGIGRFHVQQPDGGFSTATNVGKSFRTGPALFMIGSEGVYAYGLDNVGTLSESTRGVDSFGGWYTMAERLGPDTTLTKPYSAVVAITRNSVGQAEYREGMRGRQLSAPKTTEVLPGMGVPTWTTGNGAVGGHERLIAVDGAGKLWTAQSNATGFDPWTDISGGLTFTGAVDTLPWNPSRIDLVARTTDGTVVRRVVTDWAAQQPWIPVGTSTVDPVISSGTYQKGKVVLLIDASGKGTLVPFPFNG